MLNSNPESQAKLQTRTPMSVLIVDDDPDNAAVLRVLLVNRGFDVHLAASGEEALEQVRAREPGLILLDVRLPGMSGFDVCRILKADGQLRRIPILFITALDAKQQRLEGFRAGGEDYITKPFFKEEVVARVQLWAEKAEAAEMRRNLQRQLQETNQQLEHRVSERTAALEKAHQNMVVQEKMASMGRLTAALAHELNNPILFLRNNFAALENYMDDLKGLIELYRARGDGADGNTLTQMTRQREQEINLDAMLEDLGQLFSESREGFQRISWLIQSIRGFSYRDHQEDRKPVDLNQCIVETMTLVKSQIKDQVEVQLLLGDIPTLSGFGQQLKQVVLNIMVNAAQAITAAPSERQGVVTVATTVLDDGVEMTIKDNGPGVPESLRGKIFEPFFTTKEVGQGMGLGLSLCYDAVVTNHKGRIDIENNAEGGACFRILLPLNPDA